MSMQELSDPSGVWPRLMNDTVYLPSKGGALFRGDGTTFAASDPGTYELMHAAAPHLTGRQSLEQICRSYEPDTRARLVRLIEALWDRGMLRNQGDPRRAPLSDAVRAAFGSQLALLDHLTDAGDEAFARVRTSRVLVVGFGISFRHCLAALIRNGLEQLSFVDVTEADNSDGLPEVELEIEALRSRGVRAEITRAVIGPGQELLTRGRVSLIVWIGDTVSLPHLVSVSRWALKAHAAVLPASVLGQRSLIGPLVQAPGCAACTLHKIAPEICTRQERERLTGRLGPDAVKLETASAETEPLARCLGGDVAFELFKLLAGRVRPDIERGLVLQTAEGGTVTRGSFVPFTRHACSGACTRFAPVPHT
jgi:hypothetical protein